MKSACASPVGYLEVDTRASSDGEIFIHHNPDTGKDLSAVVNFASTTSLELKKIYYNNGEPILRLEDALEIFSKREFKEQKLCLDIKDFGYENKHLELVRRFNMEDNVVFVSWIPQSLLKLFEMGTTAPLILSHLNSIKFGQIGRLFTTLLKNTTITVSSFVFLGGNKYTASLLDREIGFQHAILFHDIPDQVIRVLSAHGGGICVHKSMADRRLKTYCRQNKLSLWVFSVSDLKEFNKYAEELNADVIFCNTPFI